MAITRYNQRPDIFLTMTANPNWLEITSALLPHQKAIDRPNLIARVFELKRKCLMKKIETNKVFSNKVAHVFTIEFQKRGLPHVHALLFLKGPDKIRTCAKVDKLVCVEFSDPKDDPTLFETVKCCMVHGPCGAQNPQAPCMENGRCTKKYRRAFEGSTTMDQDGYPIYRRRNSGQVYTVRGQEVDNRDVVPYNAYLFKRFNCHINVEVCAGVRCVKYIGPPEAAWRIFNHHLHAEMLTVVRLALHLPGMHRVLFNPNDSLEMILSRAAQQKSTLTGFFDYCASNENECQFTYQEFPQHFVWLKSEHRWKPREHGYAIGRMYFASPNCGERFYLRLLLTIVKGPRSFQCLRTVNNVLHETFKSVCVARGLLEDDKEWIQCLKAAAVMKTGYQLRRLFYYGLYLLNQMLQESGKSLIDFPPMPQPTANWSATVGNRLIFEHRQLHNEAQQTYVQITIDRLNNGQRTAYNTITSSVFESKGTIFFLNGGARTGKTFLYNTIALKCRSLGHIVVTVASSGIASLLLVGGRTAHSTFSIPLDVLKNSVCGFSKQSLQAELFRETKLIIWDEVPMQHRHCVEAVDHTLGDICDCEKPFGDITVVLGGDFRQILPVITKGVCEQIVGTNPQEIIKIPSTIHKCQDLKELLSAVYPQLDVADTSTPSFLTERTILSARNDDVSAINIAALNIFPGNTYTYLAADKMVEDDEIDHSITNRYPNEFLNSLDPPGLPTFKVELKVGYPIMLLRNIAPKDGLCNGTRLMVSRCDTRIIEARILTGEKFGNLAFIPRISLTPSSAEMPLRMTRRQFPV
ncbi:uncharacterized protein LOC114314600 [Camellia sinensis]|uniref:uncharacterized protein LOC114314600 n=1 Tax=Camellia sinensis TaxID=4442 RepID=UPI0010368382|nr:uncharacterized protein LOC114314600 [Camellia sinensis]